MRGALFQNGFVPPEVDFGGCDVVDALVITLVIVVGDKGRSCTNFQHGPLKWGCSHVGLILKLVSLGLGPKY